MKNIRRTVVLVIAALAITYSSYAQQCTVLGCAGNYGTRSTTGGLSSVTAGSNFGCYSGSSYRQLYWQFFFSPSGGNYVQKFSSSNTTLGMSWIVYDMGTSPVALTCPVNPTGWTVVTCNSNGVNTPPNPNQTGPGFTGTVATTAGRYYAVVLIIWQDITTNFDVGAPTLGGNPLGTGNCVNDVWLLGGNASTNPASNFIGTKDNQSLVFKTNNAETMRMLANGNIGIGTSTPTTKLHVVGNVGAVSGTTGFVQLWGDNTLIWKAGNPVTRLRFASATDLNGTGYSEKMSITDDGNVGIGVTAPAARLDVNGTVKATGLVLNASPGAGRVLMSDAVGNATWQIPIVSGWGLTGNAGTTAGTNFIGTTDAQPLVIKANNQELVRISADPAQPSLLIKPSTGQTANSFEFWDGTGSPLVKIKVPDGSTYGQSTLTIDGRNKTNQPAFAISNIGSGFSGLAMSGNAGGSVILENFNLSPKWRYVNKHAIWEVTNNAFDASSPQSYLFMHSDQPATNVLMTLQGQASQTGDMFRIKNGAGTDLFRVFANGGGYFTDKVAIGTTNFSSNDYKLFVETGIRTRKVKVDQASWADFVFDDNYRLPTLAEVEQYISANKHLPNVPSAVEVEKEGLNLGDNQALLLRKIEELTLYVIELNKKVEQLEKENKELKK